MSRMNKIGEVISKHGTLLGGDWVEKEVNDSLKENGSPLFSFIAIEGGFCEETGCVYKDWEVRAYFWSAEAGYGFDNLDKEFTSCLKALAELREIGLVARQSSMKPERVSDDVYRLRAIFRDCDYGESKDCDESNADSDNGIVDQCDSDSDSPCKSPDDSGANVIPTTVFVYHPRVYTPQVIHIPPPTPIPYYDPIKRWYTEERTSAPGTWTARLLRSSRW